MTYMTICKCAIAALQCSRQYTTVHALLVCVTIVMTRPLHHVSSLQDGEGCAQHDARSFQADAISYEQGGLLWYEMWDTATATWNVHLSHVLFNETHAKLIRFFPATLTDRQRY